MTRRARFWWAAVPIAVEAYAALVWFGRSAGSTREERRRRLPGDEVVRCPTMVTDHAMTVDAPADSVWPWLMQMGWHRAGWYTPRWVDRVFFPDNRASLDHLDPELSRDLVPGDTVPDGAPGTAFYEVVLADRPRVLVLHSTTHLPPGWRERFGATIDWTWAFVLTESTPGRTRLHLRVRGRTTPWWLTAGYVAAIVPADLVMAMGMLRGIRRRVTTERGGVERGGDRVDVA